VDFGAPGTASGITAVAEAAKPGSLKIFALVGGDLTTTNDELLVRKDSAMSGIGELRGKRLGILPGIQFRTIARYILARNHLKADTDVNLVEVALPLQVQALASKQVDALLTIEPVGTIAISQGVARHLIRAPMVRYISNPWYGADAVVAARFAINQPEITSKVLEIFARAVSEIQKNPAASRKYLEGYTPLPNNLIPQVPLPIFKTYQTFTPSDLIALQKFFDIFTDAKVIDERVNVEALIYAGH